MNAFTAAYLARLELWGVFAALLQGALVLGSWRAWQQVASSPQVRHRLACAHFAALGLLPLLTLAVLQSTVAEMAARPPQGLPAVLRPLVLADGRGLLATIVAAVWIVGVAAMLGRLALDLRALARVRHAPASPEVIAALRRSAHASGTLPRIRAADVSSPQVSGWRRPLLLVPRDLAGRLSAAELDAVLLHELAHVRRGDIRWNLLQRVVLSLLWFHPAAWSLQAAIACERERCCDALAVRHGASPVALARALVRLAEARPQASLVLAAARRGGLVDRVRALLEPARAEAPGWRRPAAALGLSALCVAGLGAGRAALADPLLGDFYIASAFGPTIAIDAHDAAGDFALQVRQGRVIGASVAQQPVRVVQVGERVTLDGGAQVAARVLTVTPQGRVMWSPRR